MPFGLKNAARSFQRFMDEVLRVFHSAMTTCIDDLLIASETHEQHKEHLRLVFERLKRYRIIINLWGPSGQMPKSLEGFPGQSRVSLDGWQVWEYVKAKTSFRPQSRDREKIS